MRRRAVYVPCNGRSCMIPCPEGQALYTVVVGDDPKYTRCMDLNPDSPDAAPQVTPGRVLTAFKRVPVPTAKVQIQPPKGKTLVNLDTNFYTVAQSFTESLTLLGQDVELRIEPASYAWNHGDGTAQTTQTPGAKYPDLEVTHAYSRTADVRVSVDVTWSAAFRVNGGIWREVPGTVTIAGPPTPLRVAEAKPLLTDAG